ncbi:MAG: biotin carboxylase N-terminal domain-containing protein [Candidatus Sericytochromatia bacterium]
MSKISKILIANRGEIANRIIKTCKSLNIETVAIFSDSDKNSLYVKNADYSYYIGNSDIKDSYLNMDKIIQIALKNDVDAIHCGYGFLSENYEFSIKCEDNNILLIAPPKEIIKLSASKSESKNIVKNLEIPVINGYDGENQSLNIFIEESKKIGFPLLIKAKFGGGGKGMKIVDKLEDLENEIQEAKLEALNSFGNDEIFLEKYFKHCRHIEFQIIADNFGNIICLGDRECSIQRRYQKIIEESPASISSNLRSRMINASIKIYKALNYKGVGTIEYIVIDNDFYFLEINPRLQVEHTITEMITGLDIIELQIKIAENKELNLKQKDIKFNGHSIQCRICSEDENFKPSVGKVLDYYFDENIRIDNGINLNSQISIFYDSMLAKFVSYGNYREDSIKNMLNSLRNSYIFGIENNINMLCNILNHESFIKSVYDTSFIENNKDSISRVSNLDYFLIVALISNCIKRSDERVLLKNIPFGWRNIKFQKQSEFLEYQKKTYKLEYENSNNLFKTNISGFKNEYIVELVDKNNYSLIINNQYFNFKILNDKDNIYIYNRVLGSICIKNISKFTKITKENNNNEYLSPLPGEIKKIFVREGDNVNKGELLLIMYSMKMETSIYANTSGTIEAILCSENSFIDSNKILLKIKENS